jgi:hypothetical protein
LFLFSAILSGCTSEDDKFKIDSKISKTKLQNSLTLGENWLVNNINEQGYFNYLYDPTTKQYSTNNNMIRQLMASRHIAEMAQENESLKSIHKKNLDYVIEHWYREENEYGFIYFNSKSKLGAIAMALRTIVYSPYFSSYQDYAYKLANTILYLQSNDGSFDPWFIEPSYEYDKDYLLTFYSGEATLSLVELYEKTEISTFLDAAILSQDYYVDRYVTHLSENYYPAYVPWHTLSLNKLYKITENQDYADAIMTLNDELLKIQNTDGEPKEEYLGRFYDPDHAEYGSPHSASDGVYTEGLAYAYEIAILIDDQTHIDKYEAALILAIDNLIFLQYDEEEANNFEYPERIIGAIKIKDGDYRIRIDTTQHAMDGFRKLLEII